LLKRQAVIETWHDRRIGAGEELVGSIDAQLESCDIILLCGATIWIGKPVNQDKNP